MKILIVYEEVPETTKFYDVEVTADEWKWMKLCQGQFVNAIIKDKAAEKAVLDLSDWLVDKTPLLAEEPIAAKGFDYVLHTGFLL